MKKFTIISLTLLFVVALLIVPTLNVSAQDGGDDEDQPTAFHIRGYNVQAIGQYPDSFSYDGTAVRPQEWGFFEIHIDAETDTGLMIARFHVDSHQLDAETLLEDAVITVVYPVFGLPTDTAPEYWEGGIADYLDLHGDSGSEAPVLPTLFNNFGSWGPSVVFVNGEQYMGDAEFLGAENVFGLTTGHTMFSEMVRNPETGEVFAEDGETYFSPADPGNGSIYSDEITLLHVVAHTDTRDSEAFPPFTMFLHINFYDFEEVDALEDVEYLTWDAMADMDEEGWDTLVDSWLALADEIETEVNNMGDEDMTDEEMDEESEE